MAQPELITEEAQVPKATPAAYLPFRTFLGAIEALQHGIPKRIDRTIWRSQSGIVQGQIMMALRFFGLVNSEDEPTPALHRFVDSPEKRAENMCALIHHSYRDLIEHDLTKMSPRMLETAMEQYSVSGETKRKAVTFFLQAAKFADLPMHPLLSSQVRNTSGTRRRRSKVREIGVQVEDQMPAMEDSVSVQQQRNITKVDLKSGGKLTLIINVDLISLSSEDRTFVFGMIDKFKEYGAGS
ncbi:MAG TPA: DUF5343 domain-containing protein [Terriglobales bacterium]|nr:DUF5343 domain-containing protein [Terriglobales bacterium]